MCLNTQTGGVLLSESVVEEVEELTPATLIDNITSTEDTVTFTTDSFSVYGIVYTVDVTYGE